MKKENINRINLIIALIGCITGILALIWQFSIHIQSQREEVVINYGYFLYSEDNPKSRIFNLDIINRSKEEIYLDEVSFTISEIGKNFEHNFYSYRVHGDVYNDKIKPLLLRPNEIKRFVYQDFEEATQVELEKFYSDYNIDPTSIDAYIVVKTSKKKHLIKLEILPIYSLISHLKTNN